MVNTPKNLITRGEAAKRAGVNPRTIDNWRKAGLLKTYMIRGGPQRIRVDASELEKLTTPQPVSNGV